MGIGVGIVLIVIARSCSCAEHQLPFVSDDTLGIILIVAGPGAHPCAGDGRSAAGRGMFRRISTTVLRRRSDVRTETNRGRGL
jgi:hypothetical protein